MLMLLAWPFPIAKPKKLDLIFGKAIGGSTGWKVASTVNNECRRGTSEMSVST